MAHRLLSLRAVMNRRARIQAGYSLVEMLVVLAIIGMMTLIAVPNFMAYYRSSKLKSGLRQLTSDFRAARQRAVAQNEMTKITVNLNVNPGTYTILESKDAKPLSDVTKTWTAVGNQLRLQAPVYVSDSNVKDGTGTFADFVFNNDGTAQVSTNPATAVLSTTDQIPINTYTVKVYTTGKVSAQ